MPDFIEQPLSIHDDQISVNSNLKNRKLTIDTHATYGMDLYGEIFESRGADDGLVPPFGAENAFAELNDAISVSSLVMKGAQEAGKDPEVVSQPKDSKRKLRATKTTSKVSKKKAGAMPPTSETTPPKTRKRFWLKRALRKELRKQASQLRAAWLGKEGEDMTCVFKRLSSDPDVSCGSGNYTLVVVRDLTHKVIVD